MAKTKGSIIPVKANRPGARPRLVRGAERTDAQSNTTAQSSSRASYTGTEIPGFSDPRKGTYDLYRKISSHPTVALVIQIVISAILKGQWSYIKKEESIPDEWLELIESAFLPMELRVKSDGLMALSMGCSPFEPIWDVVDGRLVISELKPLLPDITDVLVDEKGHPIGLKNRVDGHAPVSLYFAQKKAWIYTHDSQYGNPYGRSRHENIRATYCEAEEIARRLAQYMKKVAGVIVQLHYPEGTSKDVDGTERSNDIIAQRILEAVSQAKSVRFPNLFASSDNAMQAADLAGKSQWVLSALDVGTSDHAQGLLETLRRYDSLFFRGWLRPERSGLESEHGSRADAETHTDTAVNDSELIDRDFAMAFSRGPIDMVLTANFGEAARGAVRVEPSPIADHQQKNLRILIQSALQNANLGVEIGPKVDWDQVLEDCDIPIIEGSQGAIEQEETTNEESQTQPGRLQPRKGADPTGQGKSNGRMGSSGPSPGNRRAGNPS